MSPSRPALARLGAVPGRLLAARKRTLLRRAALETLAVQLVLLATFALISAARPYDAVWLKLALATWALWLWPLFRFARLAWSLRGDGQRMRVEAAAEELDRLNPAAPDVYRTAQHPEVHAAVTLDALEALFENWEPRLVVPAHPTVGVVRRRALWTALVFAALAAAAPLLVQLSSVPALQTLFSQNREGLGAVFYRMALPLRAWNGIPAARLTPVDLPGGLLARVNVARGDSLHVRIFVEHVPASRPVHARMRSGTEVRYTLVRDMAVDNKRGGDTARFHFGPVQEDFALRFTALDASTREYRVHAVPPPRLSEMSLVVTPPAYTRLPAEKLADFPSGLTVLPGTRIEWKGEADRDLRAWVATLRVADIGTREAAAEDARETAKAKASAKGKGKGTDGGRVPVESPRGSGARIGFARVIHRPTELRLRLQDQEDQGGGVTVAGPWRIDMKTDALPEIVLLAPSAVGENSGEDGEDGAEGHGGDLELPRTLKVPVLFRASDDFGISRVRLYHVLRDAGGNVRAEGSRDVTAWRGTGSLADGAGGGTWDGAALNPQPGETVDLFLEATDNDVVSGPKVARSATVRLRLPSVEEAREAVAERETGASTSLSSALERERRLRREEERAEKSNRATAEAPPPAGEWEVRRILTEEPRQNLQELRRQLDAESKVITKASEMSKTAGKSPESKPESPQEKAEQAREQAKDETKKKALEELKREAEAMEKRLPSAEMARAPAAEQKKALEALNKDQKTLEKKLAELRPPESKKTDSTHAPTPAAGRDMKKTKENLKQNRERLEEGLQRNLKEQKELQAFLQEKERTETAQRKRMEEAAKHAQRMEQDVQKAMDQMKEAMQKGMENGMLTPEILEKMDRVRELLAEVLDESEKQRLQRESQDQAPDAGDLQRAVRDMLEKKDGLRQDLERAIRMLEAMREVRALRELTGDVRDMEKEERALAAEMGKDASQSPDEAQERAGEQEMLEKRLDKAMQEMDRLAKNPRMKSLNKETTKDNARKAKEAMQKTRDKLKKNDPDPNAKKAAQAGADLAAKHLQATAEDMEKALEKIDAGSDMAEIRVVLEETLEFSRWIGQEGGFFPAHAKQGVDDGGIARTSKWLAARMERLAAGRPFESEALRREASGLAAAADALSTAGTVGTAAEAPPEYASVAAAYAGLRSHARGAARELMKWLRQPEGGGGPEDGEGEGDSENGGGESGESGKEGMSGRMRGMSGKQMAANQMTQELLRSMLQERQQGGSPGQGAPGKGQAGSQGRPQGSGGMPQGDGSSGGEGQGGQGDQGGESGGPGNEGGEGSEDGEGMGKNGGRAGAAANAQQQIADALESMAEAADDAGGAARKLRQLAEEARLLERELRGERPDPAALKKRQEQFRSRLLEAANAMEERGQQQERRAEAYAGGIAAPRNAPGLAFDSLATELRRHRAEARKLPLSPEQRRRMEWYYERLLAP
jgi:hypothetical protein